MSACNRCRSGKNKQPLLFFQAVDLFTTPLTLPKGIERKKIFNEQKNGLEVLPRNLLLQLQFGIESGKKDLISPWFLASQIHFPRSDFEYNLEKWVSCQDLQDISAYWQFFFHGTFSVKVGVKTAAAVLFCICCKRSNKLETCTWHQWLLYIFVLFVLNSNYDSNLCAAILPSLPFVIIQNMF